MKHHNLCQNCTCKHPIFNCLTEAELDKISANHLEVVYNAGETIFKQGTPITHIVSITKGLAKVYLEGFEKKNLLLQYVTPGEFLGGPGAFVDKIHHYSLAAINEVRACLIDVDLFKNMMMHNNKFAFGYIEDISKKAIFNFDRFISLTQKQMHGRVADALLYFEDIINQSKHHSFVLNKKDLADLTALSKDSTGRILNSFCESHIIQIVDNTIKILNRERLEQISKMG